jgi:uncharacterized protein (UPF0218 family)
MQVERAEVVDKNSLVTALESRLGKLYGAECKQILGEESTVGEAIEDSRGMAGWTLRKKTAEELRHPNLGGFIFKRNSRIMPPSDGVELRRDVVTAAQEMGVEIRDKEGGSLVMIVGEEDLLITPFVGEGYGAEISVGVM